MFGLASVPVGCTSTFVNAVPGASFFFALFGLAVVAAGVLLLASAYGLWTVQPWGRTLARWIYLVSIPLGALAIFPIFPGQHMTLGNSVLQVLGIAIDIVVLMYLGRPEIAALFESGDGPAFADAFERREPTLTP